MPKYWGKLIFTHGSFPEVGQKQKTEKEERLNNGNNNGQLRIAMPPRVAHAKPPGPKYWGKQIFSLGRFPKVSKAKDGEKEED